MADICQKFKRHKLKLSPSLSYPDPQPPSFPDNSNPHHLQFGMFLQGLPCLYLLSFQ